MNAGLILQYFFFFLRREGGETGRLGLFLQEFCFCSDEQQREGAGGSTLWQAGWSRRQELAGLKTPPSQRVWSLGADAQRLRLFGTTRDPLLFLFVLLQLEQCCGEQQLINKINVYF